MNNEQKSIIKNNMYTLTYAVVVEVASKSTQYETMSNLHSMIKKQHIIEKYYIAIHKIHKRAFLNKNMICIKMFLFFLF